MPILVVHKILFCVSSEVAMFGLGMGSMAAASSESNIQNKSLQNSMNGQNNTESTIGLRVGSRNARQQIEGREEGKYSSDCRKIVS